jgi:DNA helicase HerA-like ATPase
VKISENTLRIDQAGLEEGNASQSVRVGAGQLGCWEAERATFAPIDWVAPAGELVAVSSGEGIADAPPAGRSLVGQVPNSTFPVHVHVSDTITHNTALIGVTGSGKSYLAFHLIEAYLDAGIKVLILDLTRQHWQFLQHRNPTALTGAAGVTAWLASNSNLAIHQFAAAPNGFPSATADFAQNCFEWLRANTQLQAGVDVPARLCIVIEEAHSLVPEWNQVAQQSDTQQVNRSARVILQGRKFGLGTLLITQRTANVTKTILNQCNTIFALRSFDQTGLDFLRNYMGEEYSQAISTLPDRTAILVGKASSSARPIILKVSDFGNRWIGNQPPAVVAPLPVAEALEPGAEA